MPASLSGVFNLQILTSTGVPAVGFRLYTYAQGTTTQKTAYTEPGGTLAHAYTSDFGGGIYIALNSRGELPAPLFLTPGPYDIALKTPAGATEWTRYARGQDDVSNDVLTRLSATADATKGAALVALTPGVAYPAGSVGAAVGLGATGTMAQKRFEATNTDDTDTPDASFRVNRTLDSSSIASGHGFRDQTVFSRGVGSSYAAFDAAVTLTGSVAHDHLVGFQSRPIHAGTGLLTHIYGLTSSPTVNAGSTTVNSYGMYVYPVSGLGVIQNVYGFYVPLQRAGTNSTFSGYIAAQAFPFFCGAPMQVSNLLRVGGAVQYMVGGATSSDYPYAGYNYEPTTGNYQSGDVAVTTKFDASGFRVFTAAAGLAGAVCTLVERLRVDLNGNNYGQAGAAAMTNGFSYMPSGAGVPGVPAALPAGRVPFYFDTASGKIGVYTGGAWKWTAALA